MYQECCTQRGKREKKRIADDMVEIIEESFGLPRGWMDGIVSSSTNTASSYETRVLTPRQRIFLDLLDELPESEADKLLKTLEEKKTVLQYDLRRKSVKRKHKTHHSSTKQLVTS
ncbi:putative phage repressor protein CI [Escherichia coli]|nr:putative phage repressor protein CI [Escherichia coli]